MDFFRRREQSSSLGVTLSLYSLCYPGVSCEADLPRSNDSNKSKASKSGGGGGCGDGDGNSRDDFCGGLSDSEATESDLSDEDGKFGASSAQKSLPLPSNPLNRFLRRRRMEEAVSDDKLTRQTQTSQSQIGMLKSRKEVLSSLPSQSYLTSSYDPLPETFLSLGGGAGFVRGLTESIGTYDALQTSLQALLVDSVSAHQKEIIGFPEQLDRVNVMLAEAMVAVGVGRRFMKGWEGGEGEVLEKVKRRER